MKESSGKARTAGGSTISGARPLQRGMDNYMRMNSKSIVVLVMVDALPDGGTERQVVELLKGLRGGCDSIKTVLGVLVRGGEREKEAIFWADELLPLKQSHKWDIRLAKSLMYFVNEFGVHIIHTFGSISDLCGLIAGKFAGIPVINGSLRNARKNKTLRDRLSRCVMHYADWIVANSQAGLVSYGIQKRSNASVIYNGVDITRFENVTPFDHYRPYICMVGNFTCKKDQRALIEAFPLILSQFPDYDLILVGKGYLEQELRTLAAELQLTDHIFFITNCTEPESYIKNSAVCVLLSPDGEGLSNVLIEYGALSRPSVATNLGGNREIIEHGRTGLLVQSHQKTEISQAICSILADKQWADELGRNARDYVVQKFSLPRMIAQYFNLYKSILLR